MKALSGSSPHRIDKAAARWLQRNPRGLRVLGALIKEPTRLGIVAETLALPLNTVLRLAVRLTDLGLVKVYRREPRGGREIKWYVANASSFLVPYEVEGDRLPAEVVRSVALARLDAQSRGLIEAAERTQRRTGKVQWGTLIYTDRHGSLVVRPDFAAGRTPDFLEERGPAYLNFFSDDLRLGKEQAKQLQRDLVALIKQYKGFEGPEKYSLSLVFAPHAGC